MIKIVPCLKSVMKIFVLTYILLFAELLCSAQFSLTSATYTQNFNTLPSSGSVSVTGGNLNNYNTSLNGWYFSESSTNANTTITAGNGSSSTGDTYSFGVTGNSDRALGGLQSNTLNPTIGFYFTNNTTATVTALTITYTGETWRIGNTGRPDRLDFQYSLDATLLTVGTWTDYNSLDYQNNASATTGSGSLLQSLSVSATLSGVSIGIGGTFFIRWADANVNGSDDGMGIDDITITATFSGSFSSSTDYFKSNTSSGYWATPASWQSSADGSTNWITATLYPTSSASAITILNSHQITIASAATAKALTINSGGTLVHNQSVNFQIIDGTGDDFTINGTYILNGTQPTFASGANVVVNNYVEVDDNNGGGGESDDFARATNVEFKTGSVFIWNTTDFFQVSNVTYFQGPNYSTNKPIFRIAKDVNINNGNGTTTFNGKFESTASNPQFKNAGTKIFRDGLGGSGSGVKLTHATGSGPFEITGTNAVIDGSLILNIDNAPGTNDLYITSGASVTISGSPKINIGNSGAAGSDFVIDGTVVHNGSNAVLFTYGNLYINGYLDPSSTGSFSASSTIPTSNSNVYVGGTSNTSAGALKLTTGFNFINTFTMNRGSSGTGGYLTMASAMNMKSIALNRGVLATDNNLVTWLNSGSGSTLTLPSSYSNSYICTCDATGTEITSTGSNGFSINSVSGNAEQIFPVGTDFVSANRMGINMNNFATDTFTVVVGKGDIGGTSKPRVNRIWYVSRSYSDTVAATMKLYFTKRDWSTYPFGSSQDEVEDGFLWDDPHLVQENDSSVFLNLSTLGTSDVPDFFTSPYDSEIYGIYSLGVSEDYLRRKNGINEFTRFSVINQSDIVLPVSITNFKAYQKNNGVQIEWSALSETNVDRYEVEKSINGINFTSRGAIKAINNSSIANYTTLDSSPAQGKNFYRVKTIDKNGRITYTAIATVIIGGDKTSISIYPNPVQHKLISVQFSNIPQGRYQLILYNSLGMHVFKTTIEHAGGSSTQSFLLPLNAKAGAYVLKIFNETLNFTSRIIVE